MSGECSNCSKTLEFVTFFLKFVRFSKSIFDVLNSPPESGIMQLGTRRIITIVIIRAKTQNASATH